MDEVLGLKVAHSCSNLGGDVHEDDLVDLGPVGDAEIVQEVPAGHKLSHDVEWRLSRTNPQ